jgi:hypothetical protein
MITCACTFTMMRPRADLTSATVDVMVGTMPGADIGAM